MACKWIIAEIYRKILWQWWQCSTKNYDTFWTTLLKNIFSYGVMWILVAVTVSRHSIQKQMNTDTIFPPFSAKDQ